MKAPRLQWFVSALALILLLATRIQAEEPHLGFKDAPLHPLVVSAFADSDVSDLVATLDKLLASQPDPGQWGADASNYLWTFVERLQAGRLSPQQETLVAEHLAQIEQQHPNDAAVVQKFRRVLGAQTVGKVAPDIVGKDLEGKDLRLTEYRGSVVVLAFSGEWCGACRAEYPYERLLLELYKDRPLTILTVDSDKDPELAKQAKAARGLTFRSWWDGYAEKNTRGPIAQAWGVVGWPTTYVIDEEGVIRFVNLRQEDLLKGVKQLMNELSQKVTAAAAGKPHDGGH
jgi:peroxiredoxin